MKHSRILPEIIISVVILAFSGAFTAKMCMKAENMQNKARDLDMASLAAQSAVEAFKSEYSHPEIVYFDMDFSAVSEIDEKGFTLTMDVTDDGTGLFNLKVDVLKVSPYYGENAIHVFSLATSVYKGIGK